MLFLNFLRAVTIKYAYGWPIYLQASKIKAESEKSQEILILKSIDRCP